MSSCDPTLLVGESICEKEAGRNNRESLAFRIDKICQRVPRGFVTRIKGAIQSEWYT